MFSFTSVARAESSTVTNGATLQSNTVIMKKPVMTDAQLRASLQLKTEADVEAAQKAALAECAKLTDEIQKKECYARLKIRFDAVRKFVKGEAKPEDVKTLRDGVERGEWNERMQEMRKKFSERIESNVKIHIENNFVRFEAVYNRLVKLADRIDSRLAKLKADGIDVSVSAKFLAAARTDLSEAKTAIASLKSNWTETLNTETDDTVDNSAFEKCKEANGGIILKTFPAKCEFEGQTYVDLSVSVVATKPTSGNFEKLRAVAATAKAELKSAHANMVNAIKSIKPGQNKTKAEIQAEVKTIPE